MKKILFTGAKGLLGNYFLKNISDEYFVFATYLSNKKDEQKKDNVKYIELDITSKSGVRNVMVTYNPDIVIHAASMGNVDYCELNKKEAWKTNVKGTINIVEESKKINASVVYISSNAIFNGINPPFSEKSKPSPLDYYGKTKLEAENEIKNRYDNYSIVRLMTMYGWNNKHERLNPASWIFNELKNNKKTMIVNDIYNNYLYANDAANILWKILLKSNRNNRRSIYNVSGPECITRFEFAKRLSKVFSLDGSLLVPVSSDYFPNLAPRPKNTCFDIEKIKNELGANPVGVLKGLKLMKNEKN